MRGPRVSTAQSGDGKVSVGEWNTYIEEYYATHAAPTQDDNVIVKHSETPR